MLVTKIKTLPVQAEASGANVCPLNTLWCGDIIQQLQLPTMGHLMLVYPLDDGRLACGDGLLSAQQYMMLSPTAKTSKAIVNLRADQPTKAIILFLSPDSLPKWQHF